MSDKKYVYYFGEGDSGLKAILGGKGANLSEMLKMGIPVPPGFTVGTEVCDLYYKNERQYPDYIKTEVDEHLTRLENEMGKQLGAADDPLLVSVRSGAAVSMPGMMDTVLNLGLNDKSVEGLASKTGNRRFAMDSYRRFLQMYGDVVLGVKHSSFEKILHGTKEAKGVKFDTELDENDLAGVIEKYKAAIREEIGRDFPQDPKEQLWGAIDAVFSSWNNERAIAYRRINEIKGLIGTAVNVQAMVFGNMGENSGTGVAFTRNPATGENKIYGEYLMNAQGEDVVAGIRTPKMISELEQAQPEIYAQFAKIMKQLETNYKDMQDTEFTIQEGKLYFLQTRNGKRTAQAAVKVAVEMCGEGLITKEEAVLRVDPKQLDQLLHKQLDVEAKKSATVIAKGLAASPGAAVGKIVFSAAKAQELAGAGESVILVRQETSPEDIEGMHVAKGILTATGGMTSHAAVVARGMGKCCVAGCSGISVNEETETLTIAEGGLAFKEGDYLTLDGNTGEVFAGQIATVEPELSGDFETLMTWADEFRKLGVRANADTPKDAQTARKFGAQGIGLCRTEHMFFEAERIKAVREMILSEDEAGREVALEKIRPMQEGDFYQLFKEMDGLGVTIRFLDPPLHEFLPQAEEDIIELAGEMGVTVEKLRATIAGLHEFNPMLGHRGCRLAITYPEIAVMQTKAVIGAALRAKKEGLNPQPEIMIPLVGKPEELVYLEKIVRATADEMIAAAGANGEAGGDKGAGASDAVLHYKFGTMIEVPRAAVVADEIAKTAEFFSFGTNDLTQMTFGFSRDDAGKFIKDYLAKGILEKDPFQTIDRAGVGQLIQMACERGRATRPEIKLGICGEHGGDPDSIEFCHLTGLNYVSCSPFRVPIARLAAAQAALRNR